MSLFLHSACAERCSHATKSWRRRLGERGTPSAMANLVYFIQGQFGSLSLASLSLLHFWKVSLRRLVTTLGQAGGWDYHLHFTALVGLRDRDRKEVLYLQPKDELVAGLESKPTLLGVASCESQSKGGSGWQSWGSGGGGRADEDGVVSWLGYLVALCFSWFIWLQDPGLSFPICKIQWMTPGPFLVTSCE